MLFTHAARGKNQEEQRNSGTDGFANISAEAGEPSKKITSQGSVSQGSQMVQQKRLSGSQEVCAAFTHKEEPESTTASGCATL
jgi:hypothetical protein